MKILIISPENILPANSGGRLRTLNLVKELSKFHTISLAYIETDKHQIDPQLQQFCESILPMYAKQGRVDMTLATKVWVSLKSALTRSFPDVDYYNSAINKDSLRKFIKDHSFDMVITEFSYLLPIASEIKKEFPHLKVILDAHNVESHLQRRLGQSSNNLAITIQKKLLWRNLQRIERDFGRKMDGILAVSEQDQEMWRKMCPNVEVALAPNGVDVDYFMPVDAATESNIVFSGLMSYRANEDGAAWFVNNILPHIKQAIPDARFYIVGKNPSANLKKLDNSKDVIVTGTVEDIRTWIDRAKVVAVPLLSGGGTRLKILDAMSMAKPIVSTSLGAEGIIRSKGIYLADNPKDFAHKIVELLKSKNTSEIGEINRKLAIKNYSWSSICQQINNFLNGIASES